MKFLFRLFFALCILFFSAKSSYSQSGGTKAAVPITQAASLETNTTLESVKRERDFYEKMYIQAKDSAAAAHGDLLASLSVLAGIVLGAVAILIGGQLFSNYKLNEQQFADFQRKIDVRISASDSALQTRYNELHSEVVSESERLVKKIGSPQLLINANSNYQNGEYAHAFSSFLYYISLSGKGIGVKAGVVSMLMNSLYKITELKKEDYDSIIEIIKNLRTEEFYGLTIHILETTVNSKPVYIDYPGKPRLWVMNNPAGQ